jgi:DNA-binding response OmpR family regulator
MEDTDRPKVLLVEDHADMRAYLRKHLAPHYEILEAGRGDTGLELARAQMPDVIVADIMMPGLDGYALCRALKSDPETDFIPVILLTARTGLRSRLDGLEGGADDYLTKPFEPAELLLRIRNLLRARARLQARFGHPAATADLQPTPAAAPRADAALRDKLQKVLDQHAPNAAFDISAFATQAGLSRAHLHRRVGELFARSPGDLILHFRLARAAQLLAQRAGTVGEIAYAVGFKNLSHFVKRFRQKYGQTPAAYAARGDAGRPSTDAVESCGRNPAPPPSRSAFA